MENKESDIVERYKTLEERAGAVGLTLQADQCLGFHFKDVPGASGVVGYKHLADAEIFVYGYEFGYKSSLGRA